MERLTIPEFHSRLKDQGVSASQHVALVCPICGTVQSMASLVRAGVPEADVERYIGFSCEGRWTGAGPHNPKKPSGKRGCDWTLGGFFKLHRLEVIDSDGNPHPRFEVATPEQAQALEAEMAVIR